jgi:porphobilinogen deaminase
VRSLPKRAVIRTESFRRQIKVKMNLSSVG